MALACALVLATGATPDAAETRPAADAVVQSILESTGGRGGLCLHVGCGDGSLVASLAQHGLHLVHGLSSDANDVQAARRRLEAFKLYGAASVELSRLAKLPYADNLANLVVVDRLPEVLEAGCSLSEMMRVVAPGGVAYVGTRERAAKSVPATGLRRLLKASGIEAFEIIETAGVWARIEKPRPQAMDEWTHVKHGPGRNPVSRDTLVQPPNTLRWIYGPMWRADPGALFSAGGRNVYADGTVRDAFNGLLVCSLRDKARYKYVSPQLVVEDRIYLVARRASKFLQAADAISGKVVLTYDEIANPNVGGLAFHEGNLIFANADGAGSVVAASGELNWKNDEFRFEQPPELGTSTLVVAGGRVFVQVPASRRSAATAQLACLDLATGKTLWRKAEPELKGRLLFWEAGVVICCDPYRTYPKRVYAYAGKDGRSLWQSDPMNEQKSVGVYARDGLIWCQHNRFSC